MPSRNDSWQPELDEIVFAGYPGTTVGRIRKLYRGAADVLCADGKLRTFEFQHIRPFDFDKVGLGWEEI